VLENPAKHGTFAISNRREVLAKNDHGSDMKNLPITSREARLPVLRLALGCSEKHDQKTLEFEQ